MITDAFDTGPTGTFRTLCRNYPDDTVYKGSDGFRSLWGPIFYRGRANGTARLLVIGQDPAQTEAVTRRILCGNAGRRAQGFVEKLGFTKSYLMINAFAYAIYNQTMALHLNDAGIQAYRHQWLEAAFAPGKIEAVVNNAARALELIEERGSLAAYFWAFEPDLAELGEPQTLTTSPAAVAMSKDLKKRGWKFVGPTTAFAFMQAMGLVNDHVAGCATRDEVAKARAGFTPPVSAVI